MSSTLKHQHYQTGSILVESIVVMPIFLIMVFGMMEMTYVFKAKNTLNLATQEAVRKGSFVNAKLSEMQTALDKGMAPLYALKTSCSATGSTGTAVSATTGVNPGELCASLIRKAIDGLTSAGQGATGAITVISPSLPIFEEFAVDMKINDKGEYGKGHTKAIPNDNLNWRSTSEKSVTVAGKSIAINIQDANLLKIKTFWCQKLSVPGLDRIFYNTILRLNKSPEQHYCNQLSQQVGGLSKTVFGREQGYYIAIRSHAIARMQSPVFRDDLLTAAKLSKAIDSTTPVSTTTPPPVDTTGVANGSNPPGSCDPNTDPSCTVTNPPTGPVDEHGCDTNTESFQTLPGIDGSRPSPDGNGYCVIDCAKAANAAHLSCCIQVTPTSSPVSTIANRNLPSPARGPSGSPVKIKPPTKKDKALVSTGLDGKDKNRSIDKLISKSPTLVNQIKILQKNGWTIKYGETNGTGASAYRRDKLILLPDADKNNPASIVQSLAHEVGHALYTRDPDISDYGKLTKKEYVDKSVIIDLKDEGEATMNNIKIQREILKNTSTKGKGGTNIKIAGGALGDNSKAYNKVYDLYQQGKLSLSEAREKVGRIFANHEQPSHELGEKEYKTYFQYYQSVYIETWDKDHAKKKN